MTTICICGGGNLSHSIAGRAATMMEGKGEVRLLTRRPALWNKTVRVEDDLGNVFETPLSMVTDQVDQAVKGADVVLLCLPGYAITEELTRIRPFLGDNTMVGSIVCSTGFFDDAFQALNSKQPLFGFQRVPFVARIAEYGKKSYLWGYRDKVFMATDRMDETKATRLRTLCSLLFGTPVYPLENYMEVTLTNSNPILHTGRLYSMWREWDGQPFDTPGYFYRDWTDDDSEIIIGMDKEFFQLLDALHVRKGAIETLLEHYEATDASSMTAKIRSIPSLSKVLSPTKAIEGEDMFPIYKVAILLKISLMDWRSSRTKHEKRRCLHR